MNRYARRWAVLPSGALLLVLAAGCGGARNLANPFEGTTAQSQSIRINVENNNFNEATLRAVARGERRLGVVQGNSRESFQMNWPAVDDLRIRIDILAGEDFTTNRISVGPGETVHLTIQNPLYRSLLRR